MADQLDTPLTSIVEIPHGYRIYGATHTWANSSDPLWLFLGHRLFRRSAERLARRWLQDEDVDRAVSAALDRSAAIARGHTQATHTGQNPAERKER